ncbi:hypothetical protein H6F44_18590 [Pseudanabaena sp. FACHB-1277]|uniref:Uncharacterized protein n=1 Tax=Pseudanabaena cinerea FACHB-1277 TaxID=2949581 RepID=A0A926UY45_9CYAN|nr:hypothetical protein [Pseudanabaena cinerea]MBD2152112.1 hypothetical protein [Pseudanabaena cinerea FACHB-1277]
MRSLFESVEEGDRFLGMWRGDRPSGILSRYYHQYFGHFSNVAISLVERCFDLIGC